jgi:hypothetical protein
MLEPMILSDGSRVWFGPTAPLPLRFLAPDGSVLSPDLHLQHSPSFYRLQRRTFPNTQEALKCLTAAS